MKVLAIKGGKPVRTDPFPSWPVFGDKEIHLLRKVLESGVWGVGGKMKKEFERRFAGLQDAKYALAVANGTLAIEVTLRAANIGEGDEVILPSYTFVGTASPVVYVKAKPVFVDIDPETYCIDPEMVEKAVTDRTKAIIPVHIAGQPADMDRLTEIAEEHDLFLIEDASQAHCSEWGGRRVGAIGDMGVFSFQSSKNLTCGEGGAIVTDNEELYDLCWSIHNSGRVLGEEWYKHIRLGGNYRMTEFQAAVLLAQMDRLEEQSKRREENALYLTKRLTEISGIESLRRMSKVTRHSYHIYIFKYLQNEFKDVPRERFIEALRAEGIPCGPGYTPLHKMGFLNCRTFGQLKVTENACYREAVWLKQNLLLGSRRDMDDIADAIIKIKENTSQLL